MPPSAEEAAPLASRLFLGPALRAQPDRRLVTLVREGYEAAFEEIVRRYGRPLGRYAASIVGGRSEDVLQEAFAKALPALQRDEAEIDLRPWLFRIVRNAALNDLRDSPPSPELLAEELAGGRNPAEEFEQRERLADLMRRLRELPEAQRAAIVMRELEGLGHEEIAAALGLSDGGARQAIYRARQALRDGAGLLLPLPLLRLLIDHGGEAVGAGAGGALVAAGASAGGAGASGTLKLGLAVALVAGSVGAGVAVQGRHEKGSNEAQAAPVAGSPGRPKRASSAPRAEHPNVVVAATRSRPAPGRPAADPRPGRPPGAQQNPQAVAQRAGGQSEGPARTHGPRLPHDPGRGGREGSRRGGDLSSPGGRPGPDSGTGAGSGSGRGDGELDGAPGTGHDDGGGDLESEGLRSPEGDGGHDGQATGDGGGPQTPEEGGSDGSDGSGKAEVAGESTTQGIEGGTGREYESP